MFDSGGLPDYPPPHDAWEFPPPPVSPRWRWAAIGATVLAFLGGSAMLTVAIVFGSTGAGGLIDNERIINVIEDECAAMTAEVESIIVTGPPERQSEAISEQNAAVEDMISDIRAVGPNALADDPPTEDWLLDWHTLVKARETYARGLLRGSLDDFEVPTDDKGEDIYVRMDDVFFVESACEVPADLLNPYPVDASEA